MLLVPLKVSAFDVSRCTGRDLDASVIVKRVVEHVIVITDCRDGPNNEDIVLRHRNVAAAVPSNGESGIVFEDTDTPGGRPTRQIGIEVHCSGWTVPPRDKLVHTATEAKLSIEIGGSGADGVVGSVVCQCFL